MARPGFRQHQKLNRLSHILGLAIPYAWGLCECLWDVSYQNGNPVIGDSIDVELAAEWPGDRGKLTEALLAVRLIDEIEPGVYAIHDLLENAPDYVRKRFERDQNRKHKYAPRRHTKDNEGGISPTNSDQFGNKSELGRTHSPAQHSTAQENTPPNPPRGEGEGDAPSHPSERLEKKSSPSAVIPEGFAEFWTAYPRKTAKQAALKAWSKLAPDAETQRIILASISRQKQSQQWQREGGRFIPHPSTWLNGRRWEDEAEIKTGSSFDGRNNMERLGRIESPAGKYDGIVKTLRLSAPTPQPGARDELAEKETAADSSNREAAAGDDRQAH